MDKRLVVAMSMLAGFATLTGLTDHVWAQSSRSFVITTVAGNGTAGYSGDGGAATSAALGHPFGVAVDSDGNLYIAETTNHRVRKVSPNGRITTIAGNGNPGFSGDGGVATSAMLQQPQGVVVDGSGSVYIADTGNGRIRKVDSQGTIATIAGSSAKGPFMGEGGAATLATLYSPWALALDESRNIYFTDLSDHRLLKISSNGIINSIAGGSPPGFSGDGGPGASAKFNQPVGLSLDGKGNIYIADYFNDRIRKLDPTGLMSTVAGGTSVTLGDGGPATSAFVNRPIGVVVDGLGNIFLGEHANRIRMVNSIGIISTVAGNGVAGFSGDGAQATSARINLPTGMTADKFGNIFFSDGNNQRVRKLTPGPTLPLPFASAWLLPSSARVGGLGGVFFTTDLIVSNLGSTEASLALKFLGNNTDGRTGTERILNLAGGRTVTYRDVLGSVFGLPSGFGAIRIASTSALLSVVSQTSTPGNGGGSYGQTVPAMSARDLITAGATGSIVGIREDSAFRTNLILANATELTTDVNVTLIADTGAVLGSASYTLPPLGMTQVSRVARDIGISLDVSGARLSLTLVTQGAAVATYASVIDNTTGDPRTLLPSVVPVDPCCP